MKVSGILVLALSLAACLGWTVAFAQTPDAAQPEAALDEPQAVTESPRPAVDEDRADADETPLAYMRRLLPIGQLDESHLDKLYDGHPVDATETESLMTVLFVVPELPPLKMRDWVQATRQFGVSDLARSPETFRTQVFGLSGRVQRVERQTPVLELQEQFEIESYYRCHVTLDRGEPAIVYARHVPQAWPLGESPDRPLDERVRFQGVFLKNSGAADGSPTPVFVANRLAWHPENFLGDLGMDVGLFDTVPMGRRITARENEAFYQLLSAARGSSVQDVLDAAESALDVPKVRAKGRNVPTDQFDIVSVVQFGLKVDRLERRLTTVAELRTEVHNAGALRQRLEALDAWLKEAQQIRWDDAFPAAAPRGLPMQVRSALNVLMQRQRGLADEVQSAANRVKTIAARLPSAKLPLEDPQHTLRELDRLEAGYAAELQQLEAASPFSQGQAMVFEGVLRRVTKVRVSDEELIARFGMDHYYQLDVFVNSGRSVKLDDSPDAKLVDSWPVFFWTPVVPQGWEQWVDKDVRQPVRVAGFFFKLFEYESEFSAQSRGSGKQSAPILIGPGVIWDQPVKEDNSLYAMIAGGLFAAAVLLAWVGLWRYRRGDRKFRQQTIDRQREPEDGKSLNELLRDVESKE